MNKSIIGCLLSLSAFFASAATSDFVKESIDLPLDGITAVHTKGGKTFFISNNGRYTFSGVFNNVFTNRKIKTFDDAKLEGSELQSFKLIEKSDELRQKVKLPLDGISVIETKDGKQVFNSLNGRYVFDGVIKNVYTNKTVSNVSDAKDEWFMTIQDMNLSDSDIAPIPFGNPKIPLQARVFLDPYCETCTTLLKELNKKKDKVHVEILITPITSQNAVRRGLDLWCAYEQNTEMSNEVLTALVNPEQPVKKASTAFTDKCHGNRVVLNSILTRVLGAKGYPFMWRIDGANVTGIPKDLMQFLNGKRYPNNVPATN